MTVQVMKVPEVGFVDPLAPSQHKGRREQYIVPTRRATKVRFQSPLAEKMRKRVDMRRVRKPVHDVEPRLNAASDETRHRLVNQSLCAAG